LSTGSTSSCTPQRRGCAAAAVLAAFLVALAHAALADVAALVLALALDSVTIAPGRVFAPTVFASADVPAAFLAARCTLWKNKV
jgi:hypothetical protein